MNYIKYNLSPLTSSMTVVIISFQQLAIPTHFKLKKHYNLDERGYWQKEKWSGGKCAGTQVDGGKETIWRKIVASLNESSHGQGFVTYVPLTVREIWTVQ